MNNVSNNSRPTRGFSFLALSVTLALTSLTLSQCRLIDNTVTGPERGNASMQTAARAACEHRCNAAFRLCEDREDARYRDAIRACGLLPTEAQRRECRNAEERRHKAAHAQCVAEKNLCKRNCDYREGAGNGGR